MSHGGLVKLAGMAQLHVRVHQPPHLHMTAHVGKSKRQLAARRLHDIDCRIDPARRRQWRALSAWIDCDICDMESRSRCESHLLLAAVGEEGLARGAGGSGGHLVRGLARDRLELLPAQSLGHIQRLQQAAYVLAQRLQSMIIEGQSRTARH